MIDIYIGSAVILDMMPSDVVEDKSEEAQEVVEEADTPDQQLEGKKISWPKLRRYDSLDIESSSVRGHVPGHSFKVSSLRIAISFIDNTKYSAHSIYI